MDIMQYDVA